MNLNQFLKSKGFTDSTIKTYDSVLERVFAKIGKKFTEKQAEDLLTELNLSPRAYNLYRSVMNFYTKNVLGYELKFTKAKVDYRLATIITEKEFYSMLKTISNFRHKLILSIMYRCGLRISEVCRLKKDDIDLEKYRLFVRQGKGKKDRITVIPKSLAYYLSIYIKKVNDYLFPTYNGHICTRSVENILKEAVRKSGIKKKIIPHDLRKNFAINAERNGVKVTEIQKFLGHKKLTTTQGYLDCVQDDLTDVAMKL
jgi:integrase